MTAATPPYVTVPDDAVAFTGWRQFDGSPVPDLIGEWDYQTDLALRGTITADLARIRYVCLLGDRAGLIWVVSWRNVDGRVGGLAAKRTVTGSDDEIDLLLSGETLGAAVDIRLRMALSTDAVFPRPGAAHRAGSVLWSHDTRVLLAGDAARFPVEVVDFAAAGFDADASWSLHVEDLDRPVLGGLRLLLNARDSVLIKATARTGRPDPMVVALHEQVASAMVELAARHADELLSNDWDDDSIGASLRALGERAEGGLARLAELSSTNSGHYLAAVSGAVRRSGLGREFE